LPAGNLRQHGKLPGRPDQRKLHGIPDFVDTGETFRIPEIPNSGRPVARLPFANGAHHHSITQVRPSRRSIWHGFWASKENASSGTLTEAVALGRQVRITKPSKNSKNTSKPLTDRSQPPASHTARTAYGVGPRSAARPDRFVCRNECGFVVARAVMRVSHADARSPNRRAREGTAESPHVPVERSGLRPMEIIIATPSGFHGGIKLASSEQLLI
jgi:hypothetical protein